MAGGLSGDQGLGLETVPTGPSVAADWSGGGVERSAVVAWLPWSLGSQDSLRWHGVLRWDHWGEWDAWAGEVGRDWTLFSGVHFRTQMGGGVGVWPAAGQAQGFASGTAALDFPVGPARGRVWTRAIWPRRPGDSQAQQGWDGGVCLNRVEADFRLAGGWSGQGNGFLLVARRLGHGPCWLLLESWGGPRSVLLGMAWQPGVGGSGFSGSLGTAFRGQVVRSRWGWTLPSRSR